ncbi:TRAP transporter substrate-binding protein DctP [Dehalobacter sp. DCM]|uniref:TRAP transporter substrate-binding protein n=1 Tax=Dehalobacter sp. DCM TaxID=2907827 RepID=UPI003081DF54|nr:TRAP transporter substrate-binding protein DctP [Dehalobacter sp. DCM]
MRKKSPLIIVLSLCLILLVSLTGCSSSSTAQNEKVTLILSTHENESSWWCQNILNPWVEETEKAGNGKLDIEVHYGGELVGIMDAYDAVVKGTVDMAEVFPSLVSGQFPLSDINTLASSNKVNYRPGTTYWELIEKFPEMQTEYSQVKLLGVGQFYEPYLGTVSKPIKTFSDMKGLQFLANGPASASRLKAWGATPANVPPSDLFSSLQKGVLQGTAVALLSFEGMGFGDAIKYLSHVNSDSTNLALIMNKDKFAGLPEDLQKVLTDAGLKFTQEHDEIQVNADPGFQQSVTEKYGVQFIDVPQAELEKFEASGAPVRNKLASELDKKGLPGTEVKNYFLELENKYSAAEYAPQK